MEFDDYDDEFIDEVLIDAADEAQNRPQPSSATRRNPERSEAQLPRTSTTGTTDRGSGDSYVDLDALPSDAFASSPPNAVPRSRHAPTQPPRLGGPSSSFRQTTLFGTLATTEASNATAPASALNNNRVFRADLPAEAQTHHVIDREAMKTWVYPTNIGSTRDYQYSIVKSGLFNNTLVALPTGLGKTFIAATIMLNFHRWTKTAKLIFVAPTKPLVSQQVDACFNIAGIPRSQTTLLTGEIAPALRAHEWETKRVFFMTPQTLENDLASGIADPKSIALLVVDEAHRATGNYAYVKVVSFIRRFSSSFRVLALTATPGSKVEAVQEVIDSLGISNVEIRTEESIDIRPYVHRREEDIVALDPSDEILHCRELFSKALKPVVDKLSSQNIYYGRDAMSLTTYGLMKSKRDWFAHAGQHANQGLKGMINGVFNVLLGVAHSIKLLNFHGIKPFYDNMVLFRDEIEERGEKGSKIRRQVTESPHFQKLMRTIKTWLDQDDFICHPKLSHLCDTVLNHFMDAGEGQANGASSNTRIIVFSEYRDSAEEIVRVLNCHGPMVRAAVFVGQADTKRYEGMKQAAQIERIQKFKEGKFNVLVATSIGEEGLDIGQVDLIICYDASASPIRMLQRMGRTGRKRAGKVVLLLMRGKEEEKYAESKDGYEKMQALICEGSRFALRHDVSSRIVPRDIRCEVDKRHVEIPVENTQNTSLPEPSRNGLRKKKPPKKFHMPDGVQTGFASVATLLGKRPNGAAPAKAKPAPVIVYDLAEIPSFDKVDLSEEQNIELRRDYQNLPFYQHKVEEIETVDLTAHPAAQRSLRKVVGLKHGKYTARCISLFRSMYDLQKNTDLQTKPYGDVEESNYEEIPVPEDPSEFSNAEDTGESAPKRRKTQSIESGDERDDGDPGPGPRASSNELILSSDDDEDIGTAMMQSKSRIQSFQRAQHPPSKPDTPAQRARKPTSTKRSRQTKDKRREPEPACERTPTLPTPKPRKRAKETASSTRGMKPGARKQAPAYDESADEGDDCRLTSDLELTQDSDDGADLEGFVVDDDLATSSVLPTSSMRRRSVSPASDITSSTASPRAPTAKSNPYYEPLGTQESDGDIPSLSQVAKPAGRKKDASSGNTVGNRSKGNRATRRHVFIDDDSDE